MKVHGFNLGLGSEVRVGVGFEPGPVELGSGSNPVRKGPLGESMAAKRKGPDPTPGEQQEGMDPRTPRPGPDSEAFPGERRSDDDGPDGRTGTMGGGDAAAPSPGRATGVEDETANPKT